MIPTSGVIFGRRVRYARNLKGVRFPDALKKNDAELIWRVISPLAIKHNIFRGGYVFYLKELNKLEKILLAERRTISPELLRTSRPAGAVISSDEKFRLIINEEDHLRLSLFSSEEIDTVDMDKLGELLLYFENALGFARNEKYGYITRCPTNMGSGARLSVLFHLKGHSFLNKLAKLLVLLQEKNFIIRGYYGENSGVYGDFFQITDSSLVESRKNMGIIQKAFRAVEKEELSCRRIIKKSKYLSGLKDDICRLERILENAKSLSFREAISILSVLLLAKDMELPIQLSEDIVKQLIIKTQPAHIQFIAGENLSSYERDRFRADYIRKAMFN